MPSNVEKFLFDYKHSRFIECDRALAKEASKRMGSAYVATKKNLMNAKISLAYITSVLEDSKTNYWLAAGSLLGNIIFYLDFDLIIRALSNRMV
jgi:hypothetical protein